MSETTAANLLNDIRLLKLAQMYENAFERFVLQISKEHIHDPEVQRKLAALLDPRDDHEGRIRRELTRLNSEADTKDVAAIERAAILDIEEVERAANLFYLRHLDDVRDPRVAELFRALAREEATHARIASEALALAHRRHGSVAQGSREPGP